MTTPNNANNRTKRAIYSNGSLKSYDGYSSSMGVRFYNEVGVVDVAPINPEFVGKEAKKGDKVYNYEDRLSVFISPDAAQGLLSTIEHLQGLLEYALQDEEFVAPTKATFEFGDRACTICAPGARLRINGERPDLSEKFVLMFSIPDEDGNPIPITHILQNTDITLTHADKSQEVVTLTTGLDSFKQFLREVIALGTGSYRQGAALAAPTGAASGKSNADKSKGFQQILDEDDEFDEEETSTAKPAANKSGGTARKTLKPAKPKPPATGNLDDEFNED